MRTRDEYVKAKKRELDAWNEEMNALEAKALAGKTAVKESIDAQVAVLRSRQAAGMRQLEALKVAGEGSWEHLKMDTENLLIALKDSVSVFKSHFKA